MVKNWLPDVHFGEVGKPLCAPISAEDDEDPDDEELDETPIEIIMMLGFDPKYAWADDEEPPKAAADCLSPIAAT